MATHTLRVIREPSVARQAGLWLLLVLVATFAVHAVSLQGFYLADDFWHLHEAARTGWLQVLDPEHYRATDDRAYWFLASHGAEGGHLFYFRPVLRAVEKLALELCGGSPVGFQTIGLAPHLVQLMDPPAPVEIRTAASKIGFRSMILVYLVLEVPQFTEFDAYYFPEIDIPITRLSEPKNYSGVMEPPDATVLCAELPCSLNGEAWGLSDDALGELVKASLARAGLPIRAPVRSVTTRRLAQAYPIYRVGFEHDLALLDQWLEGFRGTTDVWPARAVRPRQHPPCAVHGIRRGRVPGSGRLL